MRSAKDLKLTAYHEAAHAVASVRFGFMPEKASIRPDFVEGSWGRVQPSERGIDQEALRNSVIMLLAGYASHLRLASDETGEALIGASKDFADASDFLDVLKMDQDTGIALAQRWVSLPENWAAIELVAKELLAHEELDSDELDILVMIADGLAPYEDFTYYRAMQDAFETGTLDTTGLSAEYLEKVQIEGEARRRLLSSNMQEATADAPPAPTCDAP